MCFWSRPEHGAALGWPARSYGDSEVPLIELHAHTNASDGRLTPDELVRLAASVGVGQLAITDHDTTDGLRPGCDAARRVGITLIRGIEASTALDGEEVHLLGLGLAPEHPDLDVLTREAVLRREVRAKEILTRLEDLGVAISWERVTENPERIVTRPHIAAAMVAAGHVPDHQAAFDTYLGFNRPAHVALETSSAADWIEAIHAADGIAILAHPGHWTSHATVRALVASGLDGLEAYHPSHDESLQSYYTDLADRWGLLVSGGSDYHGRWEGEVERLGRFSPKGRHLRALRERLGLEA